MAGFAGTRTTFNTINSVAIFKALHLPGQPVNDYAKDVAREVAKLAKLKAPINNPANAEHRGGDVGRYQRSFIVITAPRLSLRESSFYAANRAAHAIFVERGKPYVRKRQTFTWVHAVSSRKLASKRGARGRFATQGRAAFAQKPKPGGRVSTPVVHAWGYRSKFNPTPAPRRGHRTLENAATTVARARGLRRNVNLTI